MLLAAARSRPFRIRQANNLQSYYMRIDARIKVPEPKLVETGLSRSFFMSTVRDLQALPSPESF